MEKTKEAYAEVDAIHKEVWERIRDLNIDLHDMHRRQAREADPEREIKITALERGISELQRIIHFIEALK